MKKLVSVLGALCMLCTAVQALPASVQQTALISASASGKVCDSLTYEEYSDHAVITGLDDDTAETTVIPSEINGLPVTAIADYSFVQKTSLKSIVFPDTLTEIGESAFYECTALESVSFPETLAKIGNFAFRECINLAQVNFNGSAPEIGAQAFENTAWKATPEGDNNLLIVNGVLLKGTGASGEVVIPDGVTHIADKAFEKNETITSVIIPNTVTSIGQEAFSWCRALETAVIPDSVVSIGDQAFLSCDALKNLTMPDNIPNMGNNVFQWCTSLPIESVVIPEGTTEIEDGQYSEYYTLKSVTIPNSVTRIGATAFQGTALTSVKIPNHVTFLGSREGRNTSDISSPEQTGSAFTAGDADGSGSIDILDVITVNKAVLGKEILTSAQLKAIDFNGNGKPDSDEALSLMKYVVGLIKSFPVQSESEITTEPSEETSELDGFDIEFKEFQAGGDVYEYITATPDSTAPTAFETHFTPEWIPEGYELEGTSITEKGDMFSKTYHHPEKNYLFHFSQNLYSKFFTLATQAQTDSMIMTRFSTTINGNPGYYYVLSERSVKNHPIGYLLYWKQDGYVLSLETYTLTFEETVKVAESVVKTVD